MESTYAIDLTFETNQHSNLTITVPNAEPTVSDAEVTEAMTRIIDADAVASSAGKPVAIKKAVLVSTETIDYELD